MSCLCILTYYDPSWLVNYSNPRLFFFIIVVSRSIYEERIKYICYFLYIVQKMLSLPRQFQIDSYRNRYINQLRLNLHPFYSIQTSRWRVYLGTYIDCIRSLLKIKDHLTIYRNTMTIDEWVKLISSHNKNITTLPHNSPLTRSHEFQP